MLPEAERALLGRIAEYGSLPDGPFLRAPNSKPLMQKGLVELIKPPAPYLPYAQITAAGRDALVEDAAKVG